MIIHPKYVHENSPKKRDSREQKCPPKFTKKCPREFTLRKCPLEFTHFEKSIHENLLSMRSLRPLIKRLMAQVLFWWIENKTVGLNLGQSKLFILIFVKFIKKLWKKKHLEHQTFSRPIDPATQCNILKIVAFKIAQSICTPIYQVDLIFF